MAPQLVAAGVPVVLSPPRPIPVASFDATRAPFAPSLGAVRKDEGGAVTTPIQLCVTVQCRQNSY